VQLSIKELMDRFQGSVSGQRAWQTVVDLTRYHRIQASPGYRAAAQYMLERLQAAGVDAYAADGKTVFWTSSLSEEWMAEEATLDLLLPGEPPERLADFRACPISLIQRSASFEGEAEVVAVEKGERPEAYEGLDVAGKVVLTDGDVQQVYEQAVVRRGAVGILFDSMRTLPPVRERIDLPDGRHYTSFWWGPEDETKCFGFVLTPRQGDSLRRRLREPDAHGDGESEPVRVRARVVTRLYEGAFEVVEAFVPGEEAEEIVLVAHLCHPRPSANDNASGSAALLEAVVVLQRLLTSGEMPRLRRGVRFLWVPEFTGTYAYLATREEAIERMVAGLNLDMVGESQEQCGCVFLIERPSDSMASFAPELLERLREELSSGGVSHTGVGIGGFPTYRQAVAPFSGGSDHALLSDPTVGVPTPMLIQWPDRYWHTTLDTPDRVDPEMLARAAALAGAYGCFLGYAGREEVLWLGYQMMAHFRTRLTRVGQGMLTDGFTAADAESLAAHWQMVRHRLAYLEDRQAAALTTLLRLDASLEDVVAAWQEEVASWCREEKDRVAKVLAQRAANVGLEGLPEPPERELDQWEQEAARVIPLRLYRGPVERRFLQRRLPEEERRSLEALLASPRGHAWTWSLLPLAQYWADGERTLLEVADLVEMEAGARDVELLVQFFRTLEKAGLAELRPA